MSSDKHNDMKHEYLTTFPRSTHTFLYLNKFKDISINLEKTNSW